MELVTQAMELESGQEQQSPSKVRDKQDIFIGRMVGRYDKYRSILADDIYRPQWIRNYKLWRSYLDKSKYPHRSKLFIPATFQYFETILPRVASNKITLSVSAVKPQDAQYVPPLNRYLGWCCLRNKLNTKWPSFARQLMLHGFSLTYSFWNLDPLTGYPYPDFRVVDLFNFYCDPVSFPVLEEAPEVIIRVPTYLGAIKKKMKMGVYDPKLVEALAETGAPYEDSMYSVSERHAAIGAGADEEEGGDTWKRVELLLHITPEKTSVVANRKVILREVDNAGVMPVTGCSWTEDLFHMFGIGQVEPAQGLQHAINASNNMLFDQRTLSLRPATLVGTSNATVEDSKFQARAGAVIRVTDVSQVRPYVQPDVSGGMGEERMFYMGQMQETHSAQDIVRGASGSDETATQAQINNAAIETKLAFPTRNMEESLRRLGKVWLSLSSRYLAPEVMQAMGYMDGDFPQNISSEALMAEVNLVTVIEPEAPLTKQFKRRSVQEAIGGLLGLPGVPELVMANPPLKQQIIATAMKHFDIDDKQELMTSITQAIEMEMQPPPQPPPQPPMGPAGPPMQDPSMQGPPMQGPPPQQPMQPEPDIGAVLNMLSDDELELLLQAPPDQMAQVLLQLSNEQMQARPQEMPASMPAVRRDGIM